LLPLPLSFDPISTENVQNEPNSLPHVIPDHILLSSTYSSAYSSITTTTTPTPPKFNFDMPVELSTQEISGLARRALLGARKKAMDEGRPFDEVIFIISIYVYIYINKFISILYYVYRMSIYLI
jgi:hypothetical protein